MRGRPAFAMESFTDLDQSVRQPTGRIEASPFLAHKRVSGFVCDVDAGLLTEIAR